MINARISCSKIEYKFLFPKFKIKLILVTLKKNKNDFYYSNNFIIIKIHHENKWKFSL